MLHKCSDLHPIEFMHIHFFNLIGKHASLKLCVYVEFLHKVVRLQSFVCLTVSRQLAQSGAATKGLGTILIK